MSIEFVNKKCGERITSLVNTLKGSFPDKYEVVKSVEADKILNKLEDSPGEVFKPILSADFPALETKLQKFDLPLHSCSKYNYYFTPTVPKNLLDEAPNDFTHEKMEVLSESRQEHQRLLWIYQDRITYEHSSHSNSTFHSPFKSAIDFIAKQHDLPKIPVPEADPGIVQEKVDAQRRRMQSLSSHVINKQKMIAKMIKDRELFQHEYSNIPDEQKKPVNELQIPFPFAKLFDEDSKK